jgi:hypothetical protein
MTPRPLVIRWQANQPNFVRAAGIDPSNITISRCHPRRLSTDRILRCQASLVADWRVLALADRRQREVVR